MWLHELKAEIHMMRAVNDGLTKMVAARDEEIERLKAIDRALYDYKGEIAKAEFERFQREGFEEVVASRQPSPLPQHPPREKS